MITYTCRKCGNQLASPSSLAGLEDQCAECGQMNSVPVTRAHVTGGNATRTRPVYSGQQRHAKHLIVSARIAACLLLGMAAIAGLCGKKQVRTTVAEWLTDPSRFGPFSRSIAVQESPDQTRRVPSRSGSSQQANDITNMLRSKAEIQAAMDGPMVIDCTEQYWNYVLYPLVTGAVLLARTLAPGFGLMRAILACLGAGLIVWPLPGLYHVIKRPSVILNVPMAGFVLFALLILLLGFLPKHQSSRSAELASKDSGVGMSGGQG